MRIGDTRSCIFIFHFKLLADNIPILRGILLFDTDLMNLLDIFDGRAVEDGELRTIDLNQTVVDA